MTLRKIFLMLMWIVLPLSFSGCATTPVDDQWLKQCVSKAELHGAIKLSKREYDHLKEQWCLIASDQDESLRNNIYLTDNFNAAIVTESIVIRAYKKFKRNDDPEVDTGANHLVIGNELLKVANLPQYKDSLLFILSHELGHFKNKDAAAREWREARYKVFGSLGGITSLAMKGAKSKLAVLGITAALYCSAYDRYKKEEILADQFAIAHLSRIGSDPFTASQDFLRLMHDKRMDTKNTGCFVAAFKHKSLSVEEINPHPYVKDREKAINKELGRLKLLSKLSLQGLYGLGSN